MAKKIIKKQAVKNSVKAAEIDKKGNRLNKPIEKIKPVKKPLIKKAGVKKGTKRGAYNKTKKVITEIEKTENDINTNTDTINEQIETPPTEIKTELVDSGEQKYNKFFAEYGAPVKLETETENVTPVNDAQNDAPKFENKDYDFTNTQNNSSAQSSTNANANNGNINTIRNNSAQLVNGFMLLALCDFIIPNVIVFIYKKVDARAAHIDVSKTKLDSDQRASLMESANAAAAYIFQVVNPLLVFFVGMAVMYASNIQGELSNVKLRKRKPVIDENLTSELTPDEIKEVQKMSKPKTRKK